MAGRGKLAAGDSLLDLYLELRPNLVRFFAARTGSTATAEDLAQELYLKLDGRGAEPIASPTALIYRAALNLMRDRIRTDQRALARDTAWRAAAHANLGGEDVADLPPADEALAARQRMAQLVEALASLPPQMQRAFRLHKLQGLSQAETAKTMGLSVKSVEKHVSAALRALTAKMSP